MNFSLSARRGPAMALPLRSLSDLTSHVKLQHVPRSSSQEVLGKDSGPISQAFRLRQQTYVNFRRWSRLPSTTDSNKIISEASDMDSDASPEMDVGGEHPPSSNTQPINKNGDKNSGTGTAPKRPPLTAREKLRAARVLSKYTESKPSKAATGSRVLDALRESDRGKRSGLPEAPSNLLDDGKRGMPKAGLTFNFPGGNDLLFIVFSFVFISSVMFTTTYIVWKVGAIHFNEY